MIIKTVKVSLQPQSMQCAWGFFYDRYLVQEKASLFTVTDVLLVVRRSYCKCFKLYNVAQNVPLKDCF